ncbi:MAG: hypothetical protein HC875_38710 [Anaerolineales bacterium]|nr:hypothetical protein [Anaerolineales bacterium]
MAAKERWLRLARLTVSFLLGCVLCFVSWAALVGPVKAFEPPDCTPQPQWSKSDAPAYIFGQPLVYTLTNTANCTDTFLIETATLSNHLIIDYWGPITAVVEFNQAISITVHIPVLAGGGTITDTVILTASSQMTAHVKTVLTDPVVMPGGTLPELYWVYLPLIIK